MYFMIYNEDNKLLYETSDLTRDLRGYKRYIDQYPMETFMLRSYKITD